MTNVLTPSLLRWQEFRLIFLLLRSGILGTSRVSAIESRMDVPCEHANAGLIAPYGQPSSVECKEIVGQEYDVVINLTIFEHKHSICTAGSVPFI